jgi:G3E family GTPase
VLLPVPTVVVASIDPVLRESAVDGLVSDLCGAVALRVDMYVDQGLLHRTVYDTASVIEDAWVPLEHVCLSCAMREEILPTLERIATTLRPAAIHVALPVTAEPMPLVAALRAYEPVEVRGVVSVFDADRLESDLLGDNLLAERGLAFTTGDRRAVGEVLAHQVEAADLLLTPEPPPARAAALLDHLVDATVRRQPLHDTDGCDLVAPGRDPEPTADDAMRGDLLHVGSTGAAPREGVWTLDLQSWRPLHPRRLLDQVVTLGTGPLRGRGHFWLPTRPTVVCAWDGAGGQLSIGDHGQWPAGPDTHLVITGTAPDPDALITAFDTALMDDAELARGLARWRGQPDGLDRWLGEQRGAA